MTLSDIRTRVYTMLGVEAAAPSFWTDAEINRYINDAYIDAAVHTHALEIRHTVTPTASTGEYTLPSYVGHIFRATYDGYKIFATSVYELDAMDENWENREGLVTHYTINKRDDGKLRLWKTPVDSGSGITFAADTAVNANHTDAEVGLLAAITDAAGDTYTPNTEYGLWVRLTSGSKSFDFESELGVIVDLDYQPLNLEVWAYRIPDELVLDADVPLLPAHSHIGLAYDAAGRALEKRTDSQNFELAKIYRELADDQWRFLRSLVGNRTPERTDAISRTSRRTRRYPTDNDQIIVG